MSISTVFRFGTFNIMHPDLRGLTRKEAYVRAEFPWKYFKPVEQRINWYGGAVREDGGNGMYMTEAQADAWPHWVKSDIKIGPS